MIVALEKGLERLKSELAAYNVQTVIYGEYRGYVDALLYEDIMDMSEMTNDAGGERGILLINAKGKNAKEIYDILVRKTYSPLF